MGGCNICIPCKNASCIADMYANLEHGVGAQLGAQLLQLMDIRARDVGAPHCSQLCPRPASELIQSARDDVMNYNRAMAAAVGDNHAREIL
jgi:hypothetical protein